ncbi:hypothetical protein Acr_24g0006690 [Actinidia rufa]|uniref:Uncharacterized protein n=1 Tax=Actinidia rufa TaxID=165716 RepID=A0A7J0GUH1_9ERIC|nr:hypothetical protein Acr_24g0006690 [Actinidia rufa]
MLKKKNQSESGDKPQIETEKQSSSWLAEAGKSELEKSSQAPGRERHRQRPSGLTNIAAARSKSLHPSLLSISEGGS